MEAAESTLKSHTSAAGAVTASGLSGRANSDASAASTMAVTASWHSGAGRPCYSSHRWTRQARATAITPIAMAASHAFTRVSSVPGSPAPGGLAG